MTDHASTINDQSTLAKTSVLSYQSPGHDDDYAIEQALGPPDSIGLLKRTLEGGPL